MRNRETLLPKKIREMPATEFTTRKLHKPHNQTVRLPPPVLLAFHQSLFIGEWNELTRDRCQAPARIRGANQSAKTIMGAVS